MKTVYIGLIAAMVTIIWKLIEGRKSHKEGTFSLRQLLARSRVPVKFHGKYRWQYLPMSFCNNWAASWGDIFIFPIINALVVPLMCSIPGWQWIYLVCFAVGIAVSYVFHRSWWERDENLGHIFVSWNIGISTSDRIDSPPGYNNWYDDMTDAGWVHFWFMSAQAAIILVWIFMPMPEEAVVWVGILLSIFVNIQNFQAVFVQKGDARWFFVITMAEMIVIWIVAWLK